MVSLLFSFALGVLIAQRDDTMSTVCPYPEGFPMSVCLYTSVGLADVTYKQFSVWHTDRRLDTEGHVIWCILVRPFFFWIGTLVLFYGAVSVSWL